MKYYLGMDNGGTTTKAALFDENGFQVGVMSESTKAIYPYPDYVERDMDEMWQTNCSVIKRLLEKTGVDSNDIRAVGICGHGKGLYLWGENKPVRNGIISTDNRAHAYSVRWKNDGTEAAAYKFTCQHVMACQPAPLLAWLKDNEPECLSKVKYIFSCKDYIRFRLTGKAFAEYTDFSGSGLINLYTGEYDNRILQIYGLEELAHALPPLRSATDICGYVTQEASTLCGLRPGTPVAGGMFDIDACALSASIVDPEHVCMVAGTWSINEFILPHPITDERVMMNSMFCIPGYYLIEESSATSAGNLSWYIRNLDSDATYNRLNELVSSVRPQEFCPVFLPFIMASNVHPQARGCFVGINSYHSRAHIVRSIYEGVAFSHRWHYENLMRCMKKPPKSIRLAGGAAHSRVWTQIFADVMKLPVETTAVDEAGAHGAAIAAAVAAGDQPNIIEALKNMVKLSPPVMPEQENFESYDRKYELYKKLVETLNPIWDDMQKFSKNQK